MMRHVRQHKNKNLILDNVEGGYTKSFLSNKQMSIYDAAQDYIKNKIDTVIIAGKEYGTGSSRDWAKRHKTFRCKSGNC